MAEDVWIQSIKALGDQAHGNAKMVTHGGLTGSQSNEALHFAQSAMDVGTLVPLLTP